MIAPRFLPIVRVTIGASTAPITAETKTPIVIKPICCGVNPQK